MLPTRVAPAALVAVVEHPQLYAAAALGSDRCDSVLRPHAAASVAVCRRAIPVGRALRCQGVGEATRTAHVSNRTRVDAASSIVDVSAVFRVRRVELIQAATHGEHWKGAHGTR